MNTDQLRTWHQLSEEPGNYYVTASDQERSEFKQWTQGLLREREASVTFTKADGTVRTMRCTLSESVIPTQINKQSQRKPNPDVLAVWDVEAAAWRSFRWDRLTRIEFTIG